MSLPIVLLLYSIVILYSRIKVHYLFSQVDFLRGPCMWPISHPPYLILCSVPGGYLNICFPGGSDSNESTCQCRRPEFDPWLGKIPWRKRLGYPLHYSCLKNPMDRGAWWATVRHGLSDWHFHCHYSLVNIFLLEVRRIEWGLLGVGISLILLGRKYFLSLLLRGGQWRGSERAVAITQEELPLWFWALLPIPGASCRQRECSVLQLERWSFDMTLTSK